MDIEQKKREFAEEFNFDEYGVYLPDVPETPRQRILLREMFHILWEATGGTPERDE